MYNRSISLLLTDLLLWRGGHICNSSSKDPLWITVAIFSQAGCLPVTQPCQNTEVMLIMSLVHNYLDSDIVQVFVTVYLVTFLGVLSVCVVICRRRVRCCSTWCNVNDIELGNGNAMDLLDITSTAVDIVGQWQLVLSDGTVSLTPCI